MSDSEEEVTFESADEGDGAEEDSGSGDKLKQGRAKKTSESERKPGKEKMEGNFEEEDGGSKDTDAGNCEESSQALTKSGDKVQAQDEKSADGKATTGGDDVKTETENLATEKPTELQTAAEKQDELKTAEEKRDELQTAAEKQDELQTAAEKRDELQTAAEKQDELQTAAEKQDELQTAAEKQDELQTGEEKETEPQTEFSREVETREPTPTRKVERHGAKKEEEVGEEISEEKARVLEKLTGAATKQSGGWGWGGWGQSLISTATSSVSTFGASVGEGFHTLVESAEAALGAPTPEELAEQQQKEKDEAAQHAVSTNQETEEAGPETDSSKPSNERRVIETEPQAEVMEGREVAETWSTEEKADAEAGMEGKGDGDAWFSSWGLPAGISTVTHAVQEKSKTLVTGGLDVLETIGKKTYDVIAEGDLGLKHTIKKSGQKPNLSQLLKEAQEDAKARSEEDAEYEESRKCHFGAQFDDFQGMVQLEALEMLSNQCEGKLHNLLASLPEDQLKALKVQLVAIKLAFELDELEADEDDDKDHDFDRLMADYIGRLGLSTTAERLTQVQEKGRAWPSDCEADQTAGTSRAAKDIHQSAIQTLAEFTARCVEQFHKIGQLTLLEKSVPVSSFKDKAQSLAEITKVLCVETVILSTKFTKCLNKAADDSDDADSITPLITNVYLEAGNSGTYIQDAFQLLLPVMQQALVEMTQTQTDTS